MGVLEGAIRAGRDAVMVWLVEKAGTQADRPGTGVEDVEVAERAGAGAGAHPALPGAGSTTPAGGQSGGEKTPEGITGVKLTNEDKPNEDKPKYGIRIDWLNTVFDSAKREKLKQSLSQRFGEYAARDCGLVGYRESIKWE